MACGFADRAAGGLGAPAMTVGELIVPHLLREAVETERQESTDLAEQDEEMRQERPVIVCRACHHTITFDDQRIDVAGSHLHTFFNPAGIVFELGCFAKAPGCSLGDESSAEFTWFAGYLWRLAFCAGCGTHLGWQFQGADSYFYGLIVTNLEGGG